MLSFEERLALLKKELAATSPDALLVELQSYEAKGPLVKESNMGKRETQEQKWRREGRKEAALMFMEKIDPESLEHEELVYWGEVGQCGDYSGCWEEDKVLAFFDVNASESFIERQTKAFNSVVVKADDAFFYESFLRSILKTYKDDLSTGGNTPLDNAAYFLGLHPDQL